MSELIAQKCKKCGHVMYPEHLRCLKCRGREFAAVPVSGECTLLTFSEVRSLPWGIDEWARVLGVVEFAEGFRAMGWVQATKPKVGIKLVAAQAPVRTIGGEQVNGLVFKPVK